MICCSFLQLSPRGASAGIITALFLLVFGRNYNTAIMAQEIVEDNDNSNENNNILLWSSTGGGWRAMFADIGYANVFHQAGIMDESSNEFDSVVSASLDERALTWTH